MARKGWPLVAAGWIGLPLVLLLLVVTEDTGGWWRWPVATAAVASFMCVAVGLYRVSSRGTGVLVLSLFAAFPVLVLLGTITPARAERVESCQVSELTPTRELWLQQEYRVACPSGTREVVHRPSPRKNMAERGRQLHAVGDKVWVSSAGNGGGVFVSGPESGRAGRALAILAIVGLLTGFGLWRSLAAPKRLPADA